MVGPPQTLPCRKLKGRGRESNINMNIEAISYILKILGLQSKEYNLIGLDLHILILDMLKIFTYINLVNFVVLVRMKRKLFHFRNFFHLLATNY